MPEEPSSKEDRGGIIQSVRTPLGFFALCVLTIEAILLALSVRASGHDFTLLISGMLVGLLLLLIMFYLIVRSPNHSAALTGANEQAVTSFSGLSTNDLRLLDALNKRSGMHADYLKQHLQNPEIDFDDRIKRLEQMGLIKRKDYAGRPFFEPTSQVHEVFRLAERLQRLRDHNN